MSDVIEVSYTGDLLAHRRCARAWAYEKYADFHPYEVVQAMEGRLVHHAMEWLTRQYHETHTGTRHASADELHAQLAHYFRVLWARGIRTAFTSKQKTLDRVVSNLYPDGEIDPVVRAVVEGALHSEYELRAVRKVLPDEVPAFAGKSRILLTGVLDLVVQQQAPLVYQWTWQWDSESNLEGHADEREVTAVEGDVEIWDYKGTRADSSFVADYVRQLLTYAALFRDRTGDLPARCVLFFINEPDQARRLLPIDVTDEIVDAALAWTHDQVRSLRSTALVFEQAPDAVAAGELALRDQPTGQRLTSDTLAQCTACSFRFDCAEYTEHLATGTDHPDIDPTNVFKN